MKHWQQTIERWVRSTFGDEAQDSTLERGSRAFEELTELCQSVGLPKAHLQKIFDTVYSRPPGNPKQELGGVMVTILAFAQNLKLDCLESLIKENDRIHLPQTIEKVRRRQQEKKSQGLGI